jgi:hypothetical protein
VRLSELVDVYVQNDDPSELVGFELRDFRERFLESDRHELAAVLGTELLQSLDALHESLSEQASEPSIATRQELVDALSQRAVSEVPTSPSSASVREVRRRAVEDAWERSVAAAEAEAELPTLLLEIEDWLRLSAEWESLRLIALDQSARLGATSSFDLGPEPLEPLATRGPIGGPPTAAYRSDDPQPPQFSYELAAAIGRAVVRFRTSTRTPPSMIFAVAAEFGLRWTESSLRELERGERALTADEFVLLPLVLSRSSGSPVRLADLVVDLPERIRITQVTDLAGGDIRSLLSGDAARGTPVVSGRLARLRLGRSSPSRLRSSAPSRVPLRGLTAVPSLRHVQRGFRELQDTIRTRQVADPRMLRVIADLLREYSTELRVSMTTSGLGDFYDAVVLFERAAAELARSDSLSEGTETLRQGLTAWEHAIEGFTPQTPR